MKYILSVFTFILSSVILSGASWSHLPQNGSYGRFLVYNIVNQREIRYCTYGTPELTEDYYLSLFFEASVRSWTLESADWLEKSNRAEEFKDIIDLLKRPLPIVNKGKCSSQTRSQTDIEIVSDSAICNRNDRSYFVKQGSRFGSPLQICVLETKKQLRGKAWLELGGLDITVSKTSKKKFKKALEYIKNLKDGKITSFSPQDLPKTYTTMQHEVGHALGLADEYEVQYTHDKEYSSPFRGAGIMRYSDGIISADDITGLITLMDRALLKKRSFLPLEDNIPGEIIDGKFTLPQGSETALPEKERQKLKNDLRITDDDYKKMMREYNAL